MEYVIISGGVVADMSNHVVSIDMDDLEDSMTDTSEFAERYNTLVEVGVGWAKEGAERIWRERDDTDKCERCGRYVADEQGVLVDITGGDVCTDIDGIDGEHARA